MLKHHYISHRIRSVSNVMVFKHFSNGNLRFLIQSLLKQSFCYTDMKESDIAVAESIETIGLNNLGEPNEIETVFSGLGRY